ncbi:MAG: hypothetical protein HRU26_17510 [Psychroserpens sp.]|nr:hypothetical protein [Psychroserpens sp.]
MMEEEYIKEYIRKHYPLTPNDQMYNMNKYGVIPNGHRGKWVDFESWKKIRYGGLKPTQQ